MRTDFKQLEYLDVKLRVLLKWLEESTGLEFTETSSYRVGTGSVHNTLPCRGYDLRMRCRVIGEAIESYINSKWVYDPSRPEKKCAVLHGKGSELHLHLQVHSNTELI